MAGAVVASVLVAAWAALYLASNTRDKAEDASTTADETQLGQINTNKKAIAALQRSSVANARSIKNARYLQGKTGEPGLSGAPGAPGLSRIIDGGPGARGPRGFPGVSGPPGESVQGPPGESVEGPAGSEGPAGTDGKDGAKGDPGESVQGPAGADGAPGPQGPAGPAVGSFTWTDPATGTTYVCSDPEADGSYACVVTGP